MPDLFDWFVPPAVRGDARRVVRVRGAVKALLSISTVVLVLLFGFLLARGQPSAIERTLFACAILTPVLAAVAIRFTGRITSVLVATNLAGILFVAIWSYATGGIQSVAAPWLLALLAALGTFGNARLLLLAFVADLGVLVFLYAATIAGRTPQSVVPAEEAPLLTLLALLSSVVVVTLAAVMVLRERVRAKALLRRSEARFERAIEASGVVLWDADALTGEVYLGDGWSAIVDGPPGPTHTSLHQLVSLVPVEERKALLDALIAALKGERTEYAVEHRVRGRGGEWRWVLSRGKVTQRDPATGRALRTSGTNVDITERKRAEEALRRLNEELEQRVAARVAELRERQALLELVTENVPVMLAYYDADFRCRFANERYARALGRGSVAGLIGRHAAELIPAEGLRLMREHAERARSGASVRYERPMHTDPARTVEVRMVADKTADGVLRGTFVVLIEITDLKAAEAALRAGAERLHLVAENIPALVVHYDRHGVCRYANQRYAESVGRRDGALIGRPIGEILGEENARDLFGRARRVLAGETVRFERERSGRVLDVTLVPYRGPDGVQDGCFAFATDITDLKAAETEALRLNAELEQRVAARTAELSAALAELEAFSYTISHDLRAPARAVAGFSQMLVEDFGHQLEPGARALLGRVSAAGRTMGEMIDGLLDLSRIARAELHRRTVDLSRLAVEVWSEVTMAERERSVRFELQPDLAAEADPILLRTVLQNLLGNAFKYTRDTADARVAFGQAVHDGVRSFFVRDNGSGFDMQYAAKLFGAFQRMHSVTEFEGTGIGLTTVKRIVERHGGRIWAEAAPGKGATFYFTLEAARPAP